MGWRQLGSAAAIRRGQIYSLLPIAAFASRTNCWTRPATYAPRTRTISSHCGLIAPPYEVLENKEPTLLTLRENRPTRYALTPDFTPDLASDQHRSVKSVVNLDAKSLNTMADVCTARSVRV